MSKKYLVLGASGQDAAIISNLILKQGDAVYGMSRRSASRSFWRLEELGIKDKITMLDGDLTDPSSLDRVIKKVHPDFIISAAAQSHVKVSFDQPSMTAQITGLGILNLLESVRQSEVKDTVRIVQFSSSEMFGGTHNANPDGKLSETTVFDPKSVYACSKVFAHQVCRLYREAYGIFAATMIGFNHTSRFREDTFITRKITKAVARIKYGLQDKLYVGNIKSGRDWTSAEDICRGILKIANHIEPDDFVLGSGVAYTVQEVIEHSFNYVGLDYTKYVEIDPQFFRPAEVHNLLADASKAKQILGWEPKISFKELIEDMIEADLERVRKELK